MKRTQITALLISTFIFFASSYVGSIRKAEGKYIEEHISIEENTTVIEKSETQIQQCVNLTVMSLKDESITTMTEPFTTELTTEFTTTITTEPFTENTTLSELEETESTSDVPKIDAPQIQGVVNGEIMYNVDYCEYDLSENPHYKGVKTYELYDSITAQSYQLLLQNEAITDTNGFRLLDNRYLVAVGTFCNAPCGTYIDILLENEVLIPCIVGDIKSDAHTDEETHTYTTATMCASEFIIDDSVFTLEYGDVSLMYQEWLSKVKGIRVYFKNYFEK